MILMVMCELFMYLYFGIDVVGFFDDLEIYYIYVEDWDCGVMVE